jgi:hypothetical protein
VTVNTQFFAKNCITHYKNSFNKSLLTGNFENEIPEPGTNISGFADKKKKKKNDVSPFFFLLFFRNL